MILKDINPHIMVTPKPRETDNAGNYIRVTRTPKAAKKKHEKD